MKTTYIEQLINRIDYGDDKLADMHTTELIKNARQELALLNNYFKFREGMFNITSVSRGDIEGHFSKEVADRFDDADMTHLASRMSDDYCTQLFHDHLPLLVELCFPEKINPEETEDTEHDLQTNSDG